MGSPPPMRGKVTTPLTLFIILRITPAYAGKSIKPIILFYGQRDHPRLCGEKSLQVIKTKSGIGSPPPMRGKADRIHFIHYLSRITPAYAGKRCKREFPNAVFKDHPRLCGEKSTSKPKRFPRQGSPPPMRGKAFTTLVTVIRSGITPAYAGKRCKKVRGVDLV